MFGHVCPSTTEGNALPRWRTSGFLVLIQGMGNIDLKSAVPSAVNFNLPTLDHFFSYLLDLSIITVIIQVVRFSVIQFSTRNK